MKYNYIQHILRMVLLIFILLLFVGCRQTKVEESLQILEIVDQLEKIQEDGKSIIQLEYEEHKTHDCEAEGGCFFYVLESVNQVNEEFSQVIHVFVSGAVKSPNVYQLPKGSRVYLAIQEAGGLLDTADPNYVNQARILEDGERVYVPTLGEVVQFEEGNTGSSTTSQETSNPESKLVNINTAEMEELMTLTGIGEVRAKSILLFREQYGAFRSIEDLMQVDGIKEGTFRKLRDKITV